MKKLLESLRTRPVMGDVAKPDMMSEARDQGVPAKLSARALPMASGNELDEVSLPFNARTGRAIRGDAFETTVNVLVNSYEGERGDAAEIEAHLDANVEDAIRNNMGGRGGRSNEKPSAADIRAVRRHVMYDLGVDPEGAFSGKVKGTASNKPRMQDANRLYDAYVRIDPYDRGEVKAYLQGPVVAYAEKYGLNVRKLQKMTKYAIEQGGYFDSFDEFLKDVLGENTAAELDEVALPFHARTGRAIRGDAFETTVNILVNSYEGDRGDAAAIEAHLDANAEDAIRNKMGKENPSASDIRAVRRHVMYDLGVDPEGAFSGKVKGKKSTKPRMQDANRLYDAFIRVNPYDRGEVKDYLEGPVVAYAEKYGLNVGKLQKMTTRAIEQGGYFDSFDEFLKDVLRVNEMNEAVHGSKKRCNESMCERVQACTSEAAMKQLTEMAASIYAEALNKDETLPAAIMANYIADQIQAEMQMFEAAEMEEEMPDMEPGDAPIVDYEDYEDAQQYNEGMATEFNSNTQAYVNRRLVKALDKAGITKWKTVQQAGYTSYEIWPGYEITNDGVDITVMKDGEVVDRISQPKRNYKKAVELVRTGRKRDIQSRITRAAYRDYHDDIDLEEEMDDLAPSGIPETDLEDYEDDKQYR